MRFSPFHPNLLISGGLSQFSFDENGTVPFGTVRPRGRFAVVCACLLFAVAMAACSTARAEEAVQDVFDRLTKMSYAEQQAWLELLEQRAARAAQATLSADEAAEQQARIHAKLRQKLVTWKVLREVLEETNRREKAIAAKQEIATPPAKLEPLPEIEQPQAEPEPLPDMEMPQAEPEPGTVPFLPTQKSGQSRQTGRTPDDSVQVNVAELDARIAGVNLALREFEAGLDEKGRWDVARLEPLADRLKILVVRRNDLDLFRELLPAKERAAMERLESPKTAISQFSARVVEARNAVKGPNYSGSDAERQAELSRLEKISRGMGELAGK